MRLAELYPKEVENAQRPYVALVRGIIEDAVAKGELPPRPDIDQDAHMIMYVVRSVYQVLATATAPENRAAMAAHTWRFCLGGLLLQTPALR